MLSVGEKEIVSRRLQTDPSVFPSSWTFEDVVFAVRKDAETEPNLDVFIECLLIEDELEAAKDSESRLFE